MSVGFVGVAGILGDIESDQKQSVVINYEFPELSADSLNTGSLLSGLGGVWV